MSYGNQGVQPTQEEMDEYYAQQQQNAKQMKTGTNTATIQQVIDVKSWGEGQMATLYHSLVMDNGDKINIGKKKTLNVGESLSYEIVEVGQQEYCKAKSWNPDFNNNGNSAPQNTQKAAQAHNQAASFCLAYAKDCYVAHGSNNPSNEIKDVAGYVTGLADELLTWLNSK